MNFIDKIKSINKAKLSRPKVDKSRKIFVEKNLPLADFFAQELVNAAGNAYICNSEEDLTGKIKKLIKDKNWTEIYVADSGLKALMDKAGIQYSDNFEKMQAGFNTCEYLIAQTGSIMVSSGQEAGRRINVYAPELVIIAKKEQIVKDIETALDKVLSAGKNPSQISLITGPSKTADIEKTLIHGMHGPKAIHVFIY